MIKQKISFVFVIESVYLCTSYCCTMTNTIFLLLYRNCIKFIWTTRRNSQLNQLSLKYTGNSQTISSYPVRFSTDNIFYSVVCFAFCLLVFYFFKKNWKYIFWYTFDYGGGWVIKFFSTARFPETRLLFTNI